MRIAPPSKISMLAAENSTVIGEMMDCPGYRDASDYTCALFTLFIRLRSIMTRCRERIPRFSSRRYMEGEEGGYS
jgi:hypothetical protein